MNIFRLVYCNSFRNKSRFVLTCLSVVVAFYLFTALAAVNNALTANVSSTNQYRLMTSQKISITRSLPISYQSKIAAISGVEQVSYASWFAGFFRDETNQLAMTAVEHNSYFELFSEYQINAAQLKNWKGTRTGLIIGQSIADKYGWQVGDKVPISSSIWMNKNGQFTWEFVVSGIYKTSDASIDEKRMFFQHAYFDEARAYGGYSVSWLSTVTSLAADVDEVAKMIDRLFANSTASTRTTTEQVFIKEQAQQFVDMAMIINAVVVAVFFTLLLIVCNTMLQTSRERLNETAMMKAIGFSSSQLIVQVYLESFILLAVGAIVGSVLAIVSIDQIRHLFADFLPGVAVHNSHSATVSLMIILSPVLCSIVPAISIKRLSISKNLGALA